MDRLEYKGYFGSIEYSKEDDCLYGQVLGLTKDCITYEGNTVSELRIDFEGAIEQYLEHCKASGIKPSQAYSGVLDIHISPEIHGKVALLAERYGMSINAFIRKAIEHEITN
ncbi:MAG: type II toxin-antitoxin system HicB family antitoxin [Prevotellaceae bacterium]|jgi:predicted HicB family RNase H-like nuclease|nr:type II toxin-antitoxin system HicB family antitoxin [Prevotellaceae bacterium]